VERTAPSACAPKLRLDGTAVGSGSGFGFMGGEIISAPNPSRELSVPVHPSATESRPTGEPFLFPIANLETPNCRFLTRFAGEIAGFVGF